MDIQTIKLIRAGAQLNQNNFSKLIEVHRSKLALVEAGYQEPSDNLIEAIRNNFDAEFIRLAKLVANHNKT